MINIQNRLNELKPYVIGFRFQDNMSVVDCVFKKGWAVPKSEIIQSEKVTNDDDLNYHMFFTLQDGLGLDEILNYVEKVIGLNIEREKKHELLKVKVKELQNLFRTKTLGDLQKMEFIFETPRPLIEEMNEDDLVDNIDYDIKIPITVDKPVGKPQPDAVVQKPQPEAVSEPKPQAEVVTTPQAPVVEDNVRRAPNGEIIPELPPEDTGEIVEDFKTFDLTSKTESVTKSVNGKSMDLPAKKKSKLTVELDEIKNNTVVCNCPPGDASAVCPACEHEKIGSY